MLDALSRSGLTDAMNHARKEILAPLLGGNEPADVLTTRDHQVFLIDGEQMFSTGPSDISEICWYETPQGLCLIREVCGAVGALNDIALKEILRKPEIPGFDTDWISKVAERLFAARDHARRIVGALCPSGCDE